MIILGLDTSTKFLSLGLSENEKPLAQLHLELDRQLCDKLIPSLQNFLKKQKTDINDIGVFAVGVGPGSFTGLRIGIATIKGFAFGLDKPVIGISSLDIIAQGAGLGKIKQICVIVDAKRDLVYSCIYQKSEIRSQKSEVRLKKMSKYLLVSIGDLLGKINSETIFVGNGISLYNNVIKKKLGKKAIFASEEFWYPKASDLLTLSHERVNSGRMANANKILPLYLYPKECQVRRPL